MREVKPKRDLPSEIELLKQTLNFTDEELEANRQGALHEIQRRRLERHRLRKKISGRFMMGLLVGLWMIALVLWLMDRWSASGRLPILDLGGAFMILFLIYLAFPRLEMRYFAAISADISGNQVETVQGLAILDANGVNPKSFWLMIGDLRFQLNFRTFLAFKNRELYNVYYAPHTKILLSAELLTTDSSDDTADNYLETDYSESRRPERPPQSRLPPDET